MVALDGAVTTTEIVHPPAGIRPPAANVNVPKPAVAVITLVTVVPTGAQAPRFRLGVAATNMPVGKVSVNVFVNQMGTELELVSDRMSVVVPPDKGW